LALARARGLSLVVALALAVTGTTLLWDGGPRWQLLLLIYLLTFAGTTLGCIAARATEGPLGWAQCSSARRYVSSPNAATGSRPSAKPLEPAPHVGVPAAVESLPRGGGAAPDRPVHT
jgi:uncharacterized membrane protein YfcA